MAKRKTSDRVQIGLRLQEGLRVELEKSARIRGVSLNAEIVDRLVRSYYDDAIRLRDLNHEFGGAYNLAFTKVIARMACELSGAAWVHWSNEPYIYREFRNAVDTLLDGLEPPPLEENQDVAKNTLISLLDDPKHAHEPGKSLGMVWLEQIKAAGPEPAPPDKDDRETMDMRIAREVAPELAPLIGRTTGRRQKS